MWPPRNIQSAGSTWANKPLASSVPSFSRWLMTDLGTSGIDMYSNGVDWFPVNGAALLAQQHATVTYISPAATYTAVTYANNGGFVRLQSAGIHGLTGGLLPAQIYVNWSAGTGVSGLVTVTSVDSVNNLTLATAYDVGLGTPAPVLVGSPATLFSYTVPAGLMGVLGQLNFDVYATLSGTPGSTITTATLGGSTLCTTNQVVAVELNAIGFITNTSTNTQFGNFGMIRVTTANTANTATTSAINTINSTTFTINAQLGNVLGTYKLQRVNLSLSK